MSLNSNNQMKFHTSTTEPLTVLSAGQEETNFGPKYVVHIKQTIEGYDHFLPSDGLIDKLKKENVDVGDKITIERAPKSDKYPYGYFAVNVVEKNAKGNKEEMDQHATGEIKLVQPIHKSDEKFEKQFEPKDDKMTLHELTLRVDKLEKMVTILSSEAGHKPGDEEIPF